jgi:hypothetical protein
VSAAAENPDVKNGSVVERAALRIPLLVALVLAAGAALLFRQPIVNAVREGALPAEAVLAAPIAFALVVAIGAVDAWRTARRRGFFPGRMVVALAAAIAFVGLLLPDTFAEYRARTGPPAATPGHYAALLASKDARVRALVMEVVGYRPLSGEEAVPLLRKGLADPDPLVKAAARDAVAHRAGVPSFTQEEAERTLASLHP